MPSRMKKSLDKRFTLDEAEGRFKKACDQIVLLNQRLGEVQKRYKMAKRTNNKSFRYNLRLKLAVIEANRIHVSESAYKVLKKNGNFKLQSRGNIKVKGKGEMTTYWLLDAVKSRNTGGKSHNLPGEVASLDDNVSIMSKNSISDPGQLYPKAGPNKSPSGPSYTTKNSVSNKTQVLEMLNPVDEEMCLY